MKTLKIGLIAIFTIATVVPNLTAGYPCSGWGAEVYVSDVFPIRLKKTICGIPGNSYCNCWCEDNGNPTNCTPPGPIQ